MEHRHAGLCLAKQGLPDLLVVVGDHQQLQLGGARQHGPVHHKSLDGQGHHAEPEVAPTSHPERHGHHAVVGGHFDPRYRQPDCPVQDHGQRVAAAGGSAGPKCNPHAGPHKAGPAHKGREAVGFEQ